MAVNLIVSEYRILWNALEFHDHRLRAAHAAAANARDEASALFAEEDLIKLDSLFDDVKAAALKDWNLELERLDDMHADIDFSTGVRGKFFRPGAVALLPVYLEPDIQAYLSEKAGAQGVTVDALVNEMLRQRIESLAAGK